LEVVGGQSYLNVQTVIGKGFYTSIHDGATQNPVRFLDYIAYPDRERDRVHEFRHQDHSNQRWRDRLDV
jgi:hypothetical protein